ncbi:hypothetical protein C8J57DRAFT_1503356 [Mycena rebaudengoi]|nr:hypothetical protein C8J57DRAFT_1503356 [Mycena rebaudengoi]
MRFRTVILSGTGSGKTLAMILPALSLSSDEIIATVSPLQLIQDNQVNEFTHYGLPSNAIISLLRITPALWTIINTHTYFFVGDASRYNKVRFISPGRNRVGPFRPAFSDPGECLRVYLPVSAPCVAYSASMPPQISDVVIRTLRMEPHQTVTIELTTNRPNLVRAG